MTDYCSWCVERPEDGPCEIHNPQPTPCTCAEDFATSGLADLTDLAWWCQMFGCPACSTTRHVCEVTR